MGLLGAAADVSLDPRAGHRSAAGSELSIFLLYDRFRPVPGRVGSVLGRVGSALGLFNTYLRILALAYHANVC